MRKVSSLLIMFVYLVSISGTSVSIHHCQGKTSYSFLGLTINKTCKCTHQDTKHSSRCCNNKKLIVKDAGDKFGPKTCLEFKLLVDPFKKPEFLEVSFEKTDNPVIALYNIEAPPDISSLPLYIKNRVILI